MKIEIISHLRRIQTRNNFHINRFDLVGVKKFVRRLNVVLLFSFFFVVVGREMQILRLFRRRKRTCKSDHG